jgi:hypothetical protein
MADKKDGKMALKTGEREPTVFTEYFYANLVFWAFLAVVAVLVYFICGAVWDEVTSGVLEFLFVILGGGFTLVSVMDYFYEQNVSKPTSEEKKA